MLLISNDFALFLCLFDNDSVLLSTWQKFEYIEFGCVCRSKKHVWDFLKTLLDQWLSPSPMLQDFYRFNVYIFMFTNEIRPYRPLQTDVRYALCRAGGCPRCWSPKISWREMPFQSPSVFVGRYSIFRSVETDQNLKFGYRRHCRSQFVKAHSLHHTKCMEHISHKLNASQIHRFSKILLHNREDLVNFDQVLGASSLHRKIG